VLAVGAGNVHFAGIEADADRGTGGELTRSVAGGEGAIVFANVSHAFHFDDYGMPEGRWGGFWANFSLSLGPVLQIAAVDSSAFLVNLSGAAADGLVLLNFGENAPGGRVQAGGRFGRVLIGGGHGWSMELRVNGVRGELSSGGLPGGTWTDRSGKRSHCGALGRCRGSKVLSAEDAEEAARKLRAALIWSAAANLPKLQQ